jgi:hypothetical protein
MSSVNWDRLSDRMRRGETAQENAFDGRGRDGNPIAMEMRLCPLHKPGSARVWNTLEQTSFSTT